MTLFYGEHFSVASENGAWERRTFFETLQVYSSFPDKTNSLAELKKKKKSRLCAWIQFLTMMCTDFNF